MSTTTQRVTDTDIRAFAARACAFYAHSTEHQRERIEYETLRDRLYASFSGDTAATDLLKEISDAARDAVQLGRNTTGWKSELNWELALKRLQKRVDRMIDHLRKDD